MNAVAIVLAVLALAGCVVRPAYGPYPYGPAYAYPGVYPGYYYRHGPYYRRHHYWYQAP